MPTKKCFKCGKVKELDLFYAHSKMKDGHLNKCIECTKKDVKVRGVLRMDYIRAYDKKRGNDPKRLAMMARRNVELRLKEPEKYRARNKLNNALRDGKISKPNTCEICGKLGPVHWHHYDYAFPLDVIWLCPECHGQIQ